MIKNLITGIFALLTAQVLYAEMGVNALIGVNYKAEFGTYAPTGPGPQTGIANRYYDDGYNLIDSSGNFGDVTTYWGYQNDSQYDAGAQTITMTSQQLSLTEDAQVYHDQNHGQPGLEIWWQTPLISGTRKEYYQPRDIRGGGVALWSLDFRTALRWQHIEMEQTGSETVSLVDVSDEYSTGGALPPAAPFDGTYAGPNMALDAVPTSRTITPTGSGSSMGNYELQTDLIALDIGPSFVVDLDYHARFVLSAGATLAWAHSDFDARYGNFHNSSSTMDKALFGGYFAIDFLFASRVNIGVVTYQLQDLEHSHNGSYATLEFSDNYTFRIGITF